VALPLIAAALAWLARPSDPLLLEAEFPWLVLAPALIALRYGAVHGLVSLGVLAAVWFAASVSGTLVGEAPLAALAGSVVLTLVCGEFASLWEARVQRAEGSLRYAQAKLERLTRQHYLLLRSHRKLEEDNLRRPATLRSALARIRAFAVEEASGGALPGAAALLSVLAQLCQIESASLHDCRAGAPVPAAAAAIGGAGTLAHDDEMVRAALTGKTLVHVQSGAPRFDASRYLAVAPASSSDGALLALLAVERMPFLALHEETLSLLAVVLGYYADALAIPHNARLIHTAMPSCGLDFVAELARLQRLRTEHGVPASLALLRFGGHPDSAALRAFLRGEMRDLDLVCEIGADLLVLLPLAAEAGAEEAIARLERSLEARYGIGFDAAVIRPYWRALDGSDAFVQLKLFLDEHDVRL
jgi:hypothetical protein